MAHEMFIPKLEDKVLFQCLKDAANLFGTQNVSVTYKCIGDVSPTLDPRDYAENAELSYIETQNSHLVRLFTFTVQNFTIHFERGGFHVPRSPFFDMLRFTREQNSPQSIEILKLVSLIISKLKAFEPGRVPSEGSPSAQFELQAIHASTLDKLENVNTELIQTTHQYREKIDNQFIEKEKLLRDEVNSERLALEQLRQKQNDDLAKKELELEHQKTILDDKSNTHARRQIRKDIIAEIKSRQEKFQLTTGTNGLRKPVAVSMILLAVFFIGMLSFAVMDFMRDLNVEQSPYVFLLQISKQILYSIGFVGTILYYIRWQNRWFEQHAQTEFQLKQFELDMERGSWIVETSLEWKDAKGTTMPKELLDSLSSNLFRDSREKSEPLSHPLDQLASAILGTASAAKIKIGDSEIQIDPKKLAKAKPIPDDSEKSV